MSASESQQGVADATELLQRVFGGDDVAVSALLPIVYRELRARAAAYFRAQPKNHTLQPTALVHEAYMRLVRNPGEGWNSRAHFCAVAATVMRQVLVSHARHRAVAQCDLAARREVATAILTPTTNAAVDVLDLEEALMRLSELKPESARLVELRFFGGLSIEETAEVLGISESSIKREWRRARAWLLRHLGDESS